MNNGWKDISTAPKDDSQYLVGAWIGKRVWNENFTDYHWASPPKWMQAISHYDSKENGIKYLTRGWNHHNGPLPDYPTYWKELDEGPPHFKLIIEVFKD